MTERRMKLRINGDHKQNFIDLPLRDDDWDMLESIGIIESVEQSVYQFTSQVTLSRSGLERVVLASLLAWQDKFNAA